MSEENTKQKIKLLIVLGSGGHTTEMINIVKSLDEEIYGLKTYLYSSTDNTLSMIYKHRSISIIW